jgi:hypothetical protein
LDRLNKEQSNVYWTQETLAEEARYAFWVNIGWATIAIVVAGVVVVAAFQIVHKEIF